MKASQSPTDLEVAISMLDFLREQFAKGFVVKATDLKVPTIVRTATGYETNLTFTAPEALNNLAALDVHL